MFEDVFHEMPPHLARQREELNHLSGTQPAKGSGEEKSLDSRSTAVAKEG